jgi:thiosulfate/3-mercaptopyruvate sulfurtransferase
MRFTVSTSELRSLYLEKSNDLLVVDTRNYSDYVSGHLPKAVNLDLMQFHWIDTSKDGIAQFNKQTSILLSNLGVAKNKFVVFYDNISGTSSARGVWLLLYFSHNKTAMLDGGFTKWNKEGGKVETKSNPFVHSHFKGKSNRKVLADLGYIKSKIKEKKNNKVVILDSRSNSEYKGSEIRAARAGHIPSAISIDWNNNVENGVLREYGVLEKLYSSIPKDKEIITYCHGGYRAANTFVVLKNLGYKNVKMYVGSWGEWGNKMDLPVEM